MDENNINPNDMCGYESIWVALQCKKSSLIEKYELNQMTDLYKLLHYGNDKFPALFENDDIKKLYEILPPGVTKILNEFKNEQFNSDSTAIWKCYFYLVAVYFNIHLILIDENNLILERESNIIKDLLNKLGLPILETINLKITKNHVEFQPDENEIEIFEKLKRRINSSKVIYEEIQIDHFDLYDSDDSDDSDISINYSELEKILGMN